MRKYINIFLIQILALSAFGQYDANILYWEPAQPFQGDTVNIYYNLINGSLPNDVNPVQLHLGHNTWTGAVNQYTMTQLNDGWWMYHHNIPEDAEVIDFVFRNVAGTLWDNNGGNDYHIPVAIPGMWTPMNPGPNDTIRIRKENTVATNMWWGVNSWHEPLVAYQPPNTIVGDAGQSVESTMNGPDLNGEYWVDIGPFNQSSQVVSAVDFVFNWNNRQTWDNNSGGDYHFPISFVSGPDDPSVAITNIVDEQALEADQLIQVSVENAYYVELLLDGHTKNITGGTNFDYTLNTSALDPGRHQLVAFAKRDNQRVMMDVKTVWKTPDIVEESLPVGDYLGVHDRGDGTVTFAILAPGKAFVSLVGDFNEWDESAGLMKLDPAKDIFWLNVPLATGSYEYMYVLNGEKYVGDPFATDVNWTDESGNESGLAQNQKAIVHIGEEDYAWTDDGFVKPPMKDLIIYETLIRDFSATKNLAGLTAKLDYLEDLGINAIELLPPTEFPGASSWGYNPAFFMALESTYGSPDDMKNFVNEAHKRGIAVLVDLVFNHADGSSPYEQMYGSDYTNSPYMHAESNAWGFPDFDHGRLGTQELTKRTVQHWINVYHVDGYRYDHTPGIGWRGTAEFGVSYFSNAAHNANNGTYQIAEHFWDDIWELIDNTAIDSHWHDAFHDQMKANLRQGSFEGSSYGDMAKTQRGIDFGADGFSDAEACVNYLESHDEQRVIWEAQTNSAISYEQALKKAELAAEVLFTSAGIPMLYMGAEVGMDTERTLDFNPVRWFYLEDPNLAKLHQKYKDLIWLRKRYAALRSNNIDVVYKSNTSKVIVHHRTLAGEASVLVAANFNSSNQTVNLQFPEAGIWYEYLTGETLDLASNIQDSYTIPASTTRIFVNEKHWLDVDRNESLPREYALHGAFPNPFNPTTTLRFDLPQASVVSLTVYDVLGREVWSGPEGLTNYQAGSYEIMWNGTNNDNRALPSGVYLLELRADDFRQVQKLMLLK
ncbi:MAG: T9SS type A sorting domain-containing protein [Candidatus Marinimicrobia bacterium]|nr:T9SS type A sorting domain-containing protein [Candidatus Neomarinimicrobiota bacterium]